MSTWKNWVLSQLFMLLSLFGVGHSYGAAPNIGKSYVF